MVRSVGVAASMLGVPIGSAAKEIALPPPELLKKQPEVYWNKIRKEQFLLADWRAYLNNGSLGVAPRSVVQAIADCLERGASLTEEEYIRWGYETLDSQ